MELDYEHEAKNQQFFQRELAKRPSLKVKVPDVYTEYTTQRVLVTEWIDGLKLADAPQEKLRSLIPVGVELFLTQLLDMGTFHADPHPGNLYVTNDVGKEKGVLCLLDYGLCAEVDEKARQSLTSAIFHLLTGDFDSLISEDAKQLGFLPHDMDTRELQPILQKILTEGLLESGSNLHERKRKLMDISNELNQVFFQYPFSVPPFFALVTRGLGLLEGIALSGDPNFDIFKASYPYASRRAMEIFGAHGLQRLRKRLTNNHNQPA
jgi:aarF domain-containing kinase